MDENPDYIKINKELWNNKVDVHVESAFYDHESFLNGNITLKEIELKLLGDIKGKSILHLQCHFGQDTLSLARMGAIPTGVDFSLKAIEFAERTKETLGLQAKFICSDIYNLPEILDEQFDIVFTSYGTIGWLPDINKWASIVSRYLKQKGVFVFVEFHPVVWMYDDDFSKVTYRYFKSDPIIEVETGTYAQQDADIKSKSISWNHSLSSVVSSLIDNNLSIEILNEYDYSPYACFKHLQEDETGKFRIKHFGNKIPMLYSIKAVKK